MFDNVLKKHLFILLIFSSFFCFGQNPIEISAPTLVYENENLYISFDLNDKHSNYEVGIEVVNSLGIEINARAFSGDIGPNIKAGKNKSITWNIAKDNIFLDETISVKIVANLVPKPYNKGVLIFQSTVWPGWGQTKLKNGKPYWLVGFTGVACLAGSYIYNQQSINSYDKYIDAISAQDSESYYDQAVQQDNTSKILAYSAIGIWAVNVIWVALMPNEIKAKTSSQKLSLHVLPVNVGTYNTSVSLGISLNL